MNDANSLVILGAIAILGALLGGGVEAGGVKIPKILSKLQRWLLGLAGLTFMAVGGWPSYGPLLWPDVSIVDEREKGVSAYDQG